jgi:hypothetical protein
MLWVKAAAGFLIDNIGKFNYQNHIEKLCLKEECLFFPSNWEDMRMFLNPTLVITLSASIYRIFRITKAWCRLRNRDNPLT